MTGMIYKCSLSTDHGTAAASVAVQKFAELFKRGSKANFNQPNVFRHDKYQQHFKLINLEGETKFERVVPTTADPTKTCGQLLKYVPGWYTGLKKHLQSVF